LEQPLRAASQAAAYAAGLFLKKNRLLWTEQSFFLFLFSHPMLFTLKESSKGMMDFSGYRQKDPKK
jgi:hypothetical protein